MSRRGGRTATSVMRCLMTMANDMSMYCPPSFGVCMSSVWNCRQAAVTTHEVEDRDCQGYWAGPKTTRIRAYRKDRTITWCVSINEQGGEATRLQHRKCPYMAGWIPGTSVSIPLGPKEASHQRDWLQKLRDARLPLDSWPMRLNYLCHHDPRSAHPWQDGHFSVSSLRTPIHHL